MASSLSLQRLTPARYSPTCLVGGWALVGVAAASHLVLGDQESSCFSSRPVPPPLSLSLSDNTSYIIPVPHFCDMSLFVLSDVHDEDSDHSVVTYLFCI